MSSPGSAGSPLDRIEEWCRLRGEGEPVAADVLALVNVAKAAERLHWCQGSPHEVEAWNSLGEALAVLNQEQPT